MFFKGRRIKIADIDTNVSFAKDELIKNYIEGNRKAKLAFETMIMTIIMEIYGLAGIADSKLEGIVLTGSVGSMETPFNVSNSIKTGVKNLAPVIKLPPTSGSIGSAQIAKAVFEGNDNILGISIEKID